MSQERVASRYAKSLMQVAMDAGQLDTIQADMLLVACTCAASADLQTMLYNPIVGIDKKKSILQAIFKDKVTTHTLSFFDLICAKGRASYLLSMTQSFTKLYNELKNIVNAEITTSTPLTSEQKSSFMNMLSVQGKEILLSEKVNADIIGGYIIRLEDTLLDESVLTKLSKLRKKFTDNTQISK